MKQDHIKRATKTATKRPHVSIIYQYANEVLPAFKGLKVLDFGCGKTCNWRDSMQERYPYHSFFCCDMGGNLTPNHDFDSLGSLDGWEECFDIVFAANVLNVQQDEAMLQQTLNIIFNLTKNGGSFFFNYPIKPRYMNLKTSEILVKVSQFFSDIQHEKRKEIFSAWK